MYSHLRYLTDDLLWGLFIISQVPSHKQPLDPCSIVKKELGLENVPNPAGESKFPKGVQVDHQLIFSYLLQYMSLAWILLQLLW